MPRQKKMGRCSSPQAYVFSVSRARMRYAKRVLILYIILGLSTAAVVGAALVCYRHISRHLRAGQARRRQSLGPLGPGTGVEPRPGQS